MSPNDIKIQIDQYLQGEQREDAKFNALNIWLSRYFLSDLSTLVQGETSIVDDEVIGRISAGPGTFILYHQSNEISIDLRFYEETGELHCAANLSFPGNYRFLHSFQIFENSNAPLNQVELTDSVLFFDSKDLSKMHFEGKVLPNALFTRINWLMGDGVHIGGEIILEERAGINYPTMHLEGAALQFEGFSGFSLDFELRLRSLLSLDPEFVEESSEVEGTVYLQEQVEFVTEFRKGNTVMPVILPIYGPEQYLMSFYLDLGKDRPQLNGVNDLSGFNSDDPANNQVSDYFIPELSLGAANLSLKNMSAVLDPVGQRLLSIDFGLRLGLSWEIIPDVLKLEQIDASFTISNPTNVELRQSSVTLTALMEIAGVFIEVSVALPDKSMEGRLAEDSVIDLVSVMEHFVGEVNLPSEDSLQVYDLEFYANPRQNNTDYGLEAKVSGQITLLENLLLTDLFFSMTYTGGQFEEIRLGGTFLIQFSSDQSSSFYLSANYAQEGGWTFNGGSTVGETFSILDMFNWVGSNFGVSSHLPQLLNGLAVSNISISFNTETRDFECSLVVALPLGTKTLATEITIQLTHNNNQYTRHISGLIRIGDMVFQLQLNEVESEGNTTSTLLGTYQNAAGKDENIGDLVELITGETGVDITFRLKDALLASHKKGDNSKLLFGLDLNGGLDLSNLPLIGTKFLSGTSLRMVMQPVLSKDFDEEALNAIRPLVPAGGFQLPQTVVNGLGVNFQLFIGDQPITLFFDDIFAGDTGESTEDRIKSTIDQPNANSDTNPQVHDGSAVPPANSQSIKWFTIQKALGPVHFTRVGIQFHNNEFYFLLDASIHTNHLTISLDGLFASSALNPLEPHFGLHGLGIDYKKDGVEIGGALLKEPDTGTYDGSAIIHTADFSLSALGSYGDYQGHPSLFVYAFSDTLIGGPPFFFVTGLAAGFGYNRRLLLPEVDQVTTFPLVEEALGTRDVGEDITSEVRNLHDHIPPAIGESFLAVGVRFTSFKIIDSFALLTATLGNEFELDVVGLSTLIIPVSETGSVPLAVVKMPLRAVYNPGRGFLKVRAILTKSYVLSHKCKITGGFAFSSWFKDGSQGEKSGDFVLSMGGYHPKFKKPAHYPKVAPLKFNWDVSHEVKVKGDLYFALTPSMAMAGGHLKATWDSGPISAWFEIGADFLISWKPYFYEASAYVSVGVAYTYHFFGTHHISTHVGADVDLWGPDFSGKAHVHLWIVTFDIKFGAGSSREPKALDWSNFKGSFLPATDKWLNVSVAKGLIREMPLEGGEANAIVNPKNQETISIVNPKRVVIQTHAEVPITAASYGGETFDHDQVNIGSMKITDGIVSTHSITVKKETTDVTTEFTIHPIKKQVPAALWGTSFKQSHGTLRDKSLIDDACVGFSIEGNEPKPSTESHNVASCKLLNEDEYFIDETYRIDDSETPVQEGEVEDEWLSTEGNRTAVETSLETKATERNEFFKTLGFDQDYFPNKELAEEFIITTVQA